MSRVVAAKVVPLLREDQRRLFRWPVIRVFVFGVCSPSRVSYAIGYPRLIAKEQKEKTPPRRRLLQQALLDTARPTSSSSVAAASLPTTKQQEEKDGINADKFLFILFVFFFSVLAKVRNPIAAARPTRRPVKEGLPGKIKQPEV